MEHKPLEEQVLVVFGATSGIGRATAMAALEAGARVVGTGRDEAALATLADDHPADRFEALVADAADPDQVESVAVATAERFGRIDSWIHVAGIAEYARFEDMTTDEFRRVIEVDLLGPVWGARAALPHLRRERGALVVVSSEVAKRSFPLISAYSAAKHGVDGFLESIRSELDHEDGGVAVVQILPEAVDTPFFEHARTRLGVRPSGPPPVTTPERVAEVVLRAAVKGGRDIPVGAGGRMQMALQRMSPRVMDAFVNRTAFSLQRSDEPKAPGDDALEHAPHGDDRRRGPVSTTHR